MQPDDLEQTIKTDKAATSCSVCGLELPDGTSICPNDGTVVRENLLSSRIKESYEILSVINSGGMGVVYKAHHRILDKFVAIKMLTPGRFDEASLQRFQREGKTAAALSHPSIVVTHDFGVTEYGQPFMVLEYVEGISLAERIKQGALSVQEAVALAEQLCDALSYAHKSGILHRDIKPSNVMLVNGKLDKVKIIDFGIAKSILPQPGLDGSLTSTGELLGSPLYMSPEQSNGKAVDGRSDLYSLGCLLFECLVGMPPFTGKTAVETLMLHLNESPSSMKEASLGKEFPAYLEKIVAKLLEKNPDARYQSVDELARELKDPTVRASASTAEAPKRQPLLPIAICGMVILACVGSFVFFKPNASENDQTKAPPDSGLQTKIEDALQAGGNHSASPAIDKARQRQNDLDLLRSQVNHAREVVDATGSALNDEDMNELKNDRQMNALKISNTEIGDAGFQIIGQLKGLAVIHADHTRVTNKGINAIAGLSKLICLQISENTIDDDCTPALSRLESLTELTLRDTGISNEGVRNLRTLKHLRHIQLNRTSITDDAIESIVDNCPDLQVLHARDNKHITSRSLSYLDKAHNLQKLTLAGCSIAPAEMRKFLDSHPQVKEVISNNEQSILQELGR